MTGRPPKPTALKLLEGNRGKRPLNKREPQPRPGALVCPSWLEPEARKVWRRVAPELKRLGLLTAVDLDSFALYCQAWARWREADQAKDLYGIRAYTPVIERLMQQFGLTPASRVRLQVPDKGEAVDPMAALLD